MSTAPLFTPQRERASGKALKQFLSRNASTGSGRYSTSGAFMPLISSQKPRVTSKIKIGAK